MKKNKQLTPLLFSTVGVAVMAAILIAVNIVANSAKVRMDLTEEKLYTFSAGTKAILQKLDTPVKIRFYFSQTDDNSPAMVYLRGYAERVEDLLEEYRLASNGMIEVEKLDPQPDSDAEDSANLDGVEGQMIDLADKVYLGLSIRCVDQLSTIPFLTPTKENLLEYDISRAIAQVIATEKPVVGVMTPLPAFGTSANPMMMQMGQQGQEPWVFINELKRDFEVKQVEMSSESIPDDIKVLLVIHPKNISDTAQFAIDQFVLRGGKLIAFLDPLSIVDSRGQQNPMQRMSSGGSSLDKLLSAWGVAFDTSKVVADVNFSAQISRGGRPEPMPAVLALTGEAADTNDVVTSQMNSLLMPFAGVFTGTPASGLTQTVLLKTSTESQLIERMIAEMAGEQIARDFKSSDKEHTLAVRLTGKFKTAFPDGKPSAASEEQKEGEKPADNSLKESQADGAVVLIGDSDMLFDQFVAQVQNVFGQRFMSLINDNLNLVQGLTEQMGGDSSLIGVRSRATLNRPFTVVRKMQAQAEDSYRAKIKELETELATAQQRLNELQQQKGEGQRMIVSPEQQKEIEKFRKREAEVKKELKAVSKQLRRDIDSLENRLTWLNIAGMPLVVTFSGIALALVKRKKTSAK